MPVSIDELARAADLPMPGPDAHGQAALLLAESMLHGLIARSVIRVEDAIEIVTVAAEVKQEVAQLSDESDRKAEKSQQLLNAIRDSLGSDLDERSSSNLPI